MKPVTRVQETARAKRYDLLTAHARRIGAEALVLAHHADDQAETLLMRMAAGSGPEGLSGMRALSPREGLVFVRPFLGVAKAELVATAQARGWEWHEDPSNQQERFERVRVRQVKALRDALGLTSKRLGRLAQRLQRQQEAIDQMVADSWTRLARSEAGHIGFEREFWSLPPEIRLRLLAKGLEILRPAVTVRLERLETVEAVLHASAQAGLKARRTLGGCVLSITLKADVILTVESARRGHRHLSV